MKSNIFFSIMILFYRTSIGLLLVVFFLNQIAAEEENEPIEFKKKIEEIRNSLALISKKIEEIKKIPNDEIKHRLSFSPKEDFKISKTIQSKNPEIEGSFDKFFIDEKLNRKSNRSGLYFLPFVGLISSENLIWQSIAAEFEIEEGIGTSSGLSIGYERKNFFSDIQISYIQNRMKTIDIPLSFSGDSKSWGFHVNGGGRIHLNQYISFSIGAGIGVIDRDLSFLLDVIPVEEEKSVLSYQIFTGLQFRPVESTSISLRYRWLHFDEMNLFSDQDLHSLELGLGYLF